MKTLQERKAELEAELALINEQIAQENQTYYAVIHDTDIVDVAITTDEAEEIVEDYINRVIPAIYNDTHTANVFFQKCTKEIYDYMILFGNTTEYSIHGELVTFKK